ncbi:MAG TPA: hypothetical protein VME22_00445 [Solirubrobacteraceae bacterium]|nr:hypothetical protein [Solirubrobacteraceae bacterium]
MEQKWVDAAMKAAAIDPAHWRPGRGVDQNRQTIQAVYGYYGERFVAHNFLLWADMANVIGATFYAAFMDLAILPDAARRLVDGLGRAWRHFRRDAAGPLGFYETLFLTMQKKIFEDQASMHEAYLASGLPEIERFYRAGIIDLATLQAWQEIDRGRNDGAQDALDNGCRMLLWREQRDIIDRFYVTMFRHHGPEGWAFTYAMTLAGTPSVPEAHSMAEVFPVVFPPKRIPAPIRITTPLPDGNVAHFADRWRLIEADTLPAYLKYVCDEKDAALKSALVPVAERAKQYRLDITARPLILGLLTRWGIRTGSGPSADALGGWSSTEVGAEPVVLNLRTKSSARTLGLAAERRNLVWTAPGRRPFKVEVDLPTGRVYTADAEMVAATSFPAPGPPNHLSVRLAPMDLEAAEACLGQYATAWGVAPNEIAKWQSSAAGLASSTHRAHSTQVFRPAPVDFVRLEFEVAHHVGDKFFVISALFSW